MAIDLQRQTDEALAELCRVRGATDDRPFAELFRRHRDWVWRVCFRYLGNAHDAEDLCQEVFLKAYRGLVGFEGRATFRSWLHRVVFNTCANELRRRRRRPQEAASEAESRLESVPAREDPAAELLEREGRRRLSEALARLRPAELEVLQLRELEGLAYEEIAAELGLGLSAAKMRVQRARLALQKAFRELAAEAAGTGRGEG